LDLRRLRHLQFHLINALDAFYTKRSRSLSVPDVRAPIFIASARLVPRSNTAGPIARIWPLPGAPTNSSPMVAECGANRPAASKNATSGQLAIASNARAHYAPKRAHAFVSKRRRYCEENLCTCLNQIRPVGTFAGTLTEVISGRREYEHRTSCRAPGDSARWDRRRWSQDREPAVQAVPPLTRPRMKRPRGRAVPSPGRHGH
jgi:hypothetical protein